MDYFVKPLSIKLQPKASAAIQTRIGGAVSYTGNGLYHVTFYSTKG